MGILYILGAMIIHIVLIDFIFKMRSVIDIITSDSSFLIKRKLERTRKIKYTLIGLISASILVFEGINYVYYYFQSAFYKLRIILITVGLLTRLVYLITFLWMTYVWGNLIKKFVEKKQAKLG